MTLVSSITHGSREDKHDDDITAVEGVENDFQAENIESFSVASYPHKLMTQNNTEYNKYYDYVSNTNDEHNHTEDMNRAKRNSNKKGKEKESKKVPNSYFIFCKEQRSRAHKLFPNLSSREITKILAHEWRNMIPSQRQIWVNKHLQLKYDSNMNKQNNEFMKNLYNINTLHSINSVLMLQGTNGLSAPIPAIITLLNQK